MDEVVEELVFESILLCCLCGISVGKLVVLLLVVVVVVAVVSELNSNRIKSELRITALYEPTNLHNS